MQNKTACTAHAARRLGLHFVALATLDARPPDSLDIYEVPAYPIIWRLAPGTSREQSYGNRTSLANRPV